MKWTFFGCLIFLIGCGPVPQKLLTQKITCYTVDGHVIFQKDHVHAMVSEGTWYVDIDDHGGQTLVSGNCIVEQSPLP